MSVENLQILVSCCCFNSCIASYAVIRFPVWYIIANGTMINIPNTPCGHLYYHFDNLVNISAIVLAIMVYSVLYKFLVPVIMFTCISISVSLLFLSYSNQHTCCHYKHQLTIFVLLASEK